MIRSLLKIPIKLLLSNNKSHLVKVHLRFIHNSISKTPEDHNPSLLTISYLIDSCGLSPQSAISTAKKIKLKTTENSDSILDFFKSQDFTNTQIANLISKCPILLLANKDKTIKPKLDYLRSVGYSGTELAAFASSVPQVLTASLEKRLKPNFELLRSVIGDSRKIASAVRQTSALLQGNLETNFLPNVRILQSCGVPDTNIAKLAALHPRVALMPTNKFKEMVELIREMGFNPLKTLFIHGVGAVSRFNPLTWEKKMRVYKSVGWSEKNVFTAFSKHPMCMLVSEEKIRKAMEFYAKTMQWGPSFVSTRPVLMCLSLEKRVLPRCSILDMLISKGLEERCSSVWFLLISEKDFLNKYVIQYMKKVPAVLKAYEDSLGSVEPKGGSISVKDS